MPTPTCLVFTTERSICAPASCDRTREDLITRCAGAAYDPVALCPRFDAFIVETFGGDAALIRYVDGVLGYCLTGLTHLQEFYLFVGDGKNGKSTLLSVILRLMGEYARPILASTLFEGHRSDQADYDLALVAGARLVFAQEAESKAQLHAARLKAMSGGDTIACRPICRAPFFFRPCAKIIMVANRRPDLDCYDEALKRRIRVVAFDHQVPEARRDLCLEDKLTAELPGILNRLVRAGAEYVAGKIPAPEAVLKATTGYFFEKDAVASYLDERVERAAGYDVSKAWLYQDYVEWCKTECRQPLSKRELTRVLRKKGYEDKHTRDGAAWRTVRIAARAVWATEPEVDVSAIMGGGGKHGLRSSARCQPPSPASSPRRRLLEPSGGRVGRSSAISVRRGRPCGRHLASPRRRPSRRA